MKYKPQNKSGVGRKKEAQPLKDVIKELLDTYRLQGKYHQQRLVTLWPDVMGPFIASRTGRVFVKDQTLFVELTSAPLKEELMMSRDRIIKLLNDRVGAQVITDVRLL